MILITGSEGLIGKTLMSHFDKLGIRFQRFDIALAKSHPNHGDIRKSFCEQVDIERIEGVIHLAAISRVIWAQEDPEQCWLTNAMGTFNILNDLFRSKSKPWIIYASSREVYGQQASFPVKENADLLALNHYALSKLSAEEMVNTFKRRGLRTQILRLSSVYGRTDDHHDRVLPAFCRAAALGETMRIDGRDNILDFTYVDDVADGFVRTIDAIRKNKKLSPAIHLTTGVATTLYQAACMAKESSNNTSDMIDAAPRNYDVAQFYGDPSLALKELGWQPQVKVSEGIKRFVTAFTNNTVTI